jgi:hypothetical protein
MKAATPQSKLLYNHRMMNINPKVVGFILLILLVGGLVYWYSEEHFEANPPAPDTALAR